MLLSSVCQLTINGDDDDDDDNDNDVCVCVFDWQLSIRRHGGRHNYSTPLNKWRHSPEMTSHSSVSFPPSECVDIYCHCTISPLLW